MIGRLDGVVSATMDCLQLCNCAQSEMSDDAPAGVKGLAILSLNYMVSKLDS